MEDQFYVHLFSNASDNYFPANKPWEFTSMLPEPILLQGRWVCALTEIEYSRKNTDTQLPLHLAVYSNICKASITGLEKSSLLRYMPLSRRKGQRIFYSPSSLKHLLANKHDMDRIHISIKCPDGPQKPYSMTDLAG